VTQKDLVEVFAALNLGDISIDGEGRIVIANREVAQRFEALASASAKPTRPKPNTNCVGCNAVAGCNGTNTVKNCGCASQSL
jgi:hypothetical protein